MPDNKKKATIVFMIIAALFGLGLGLSDSVLSNYFYDAYNVDAFQRGLIEFPRESPGVISLFVLSAFAFLGDRRLSIIAHVLKIIGIVVLGFFSPPFAVMLIFLFIFSLGMHMFMTLYDSMGMSLAENGNFGAAMGRFNSIRTAFAMIAGILIFAGFRWGFFSFTTPIIWNFIIAGILASVSLGLLIYLRRLVDEKKPKKSKFVFRKEYSKYYIITSLFGARKQIMYVYAPWVLIELLGFGADYMALLIVAGSALGIFFIPIVGRFIDRFGTGNVMMVESALFLLIYLGYGILSAGLHGGWLAGAGIIVVVAVGVNIIDRMTIQFGMVRSIYMRSIALSQEDVTPTLSAGMAADHVVSIASAIFCGFLWWELGPQYVFVFAGLLTIGNLIVARLIKKQQIKDKTNES